MGDLWAMTLPLALGAAVSPTVLIANLLVLGMPDRPRARGAAFAAGALLDLAVVGFVAYFLLHTAATNRGSSSAFFDWVDVVFGVLLLAAGVHALVAAPKPPTGRQERLQQAPSRDFFVFGLVVMATNFTTLMLFIPAMKDVAVAPVDRADKVVVVAVVFLITSVVVWLPLALDLAAPGAAGRVLGALNRFLAEHQRAVTVVAAFGFGLYLGVKGLRGL
jgi:threonine/homoserine/homoserine lactone efflux protein